jgi:hypothetical protein
LSVWWWRGSTTTSPSRLLENVLSALLAVFLWWLPLLGVNLHIH